MAEPTPQEIADLRKRYLAYLASQDAARKLPPQPVIDEQRKASAAARKPGDVRGSMQDVGDTTREPSGMDALASSLQGAAGADAAPPMMPIQIGQRSGSTTVQRGIKLDPSVAGLSQQAAKDEAAAAQQEYQASKAIGAESLDARLAMQKDVEASDQAAKAQQADLQAQQQQYAAEVAKWSAEAAKEINPSKVFEDMSVPARILLTLAHGITAGIRGYSRNQIEDRLPDVVRQQVDNSIKAQILNRQGAMYKAGQSASMLDRLQAKIGDSRVAQAAYRVQAMQNLEQRVQIARDRQADPMAQAVLLKSQSAIAKAKQQAAIDLAQITSDRVASTSGASQATYASPEQMAQLAPAAEAKAQQDQIAKTPAEVTKQLKANISAIAALDVLINDARDKGLPSGSRVDDHRELVEQLISREVEPAVNLKLGIVSPSVRTAELVKRAMGDIPGYYERAKNAAKGSDALYGYVQQLKSLRDSLSAPVVSTLQERPYLRKIVAGSAVSAAEMAKRNAELIRRSRGDE